MGTIQEIKSRITAKGNQLASDIKDSIAKISLHHSQPTTISQSMDVPSRPWMLTGGICVAAGIIGSMISDSKFPYLLGTLGLVSLGVGFAKKNSPNSAKTTQSISNTNLEEEKAFIIEKCNKILDSKKSEWDTFMESIKIEIQDLIKTSEIPDEKKEEFLSLTYYPETLSLSTLPLIDKFDTINANLDITNQIMSKKSDFANEVAINIIQTTNLQVQIFSKITL